MQKLVPSSGYDVLRFCVAKLAVSISYLVFGYQSLLSFLHSRDVKCELEVILLGHSHALVARVALQ